MQSILNASSSTMANASTAFDPNSMGPRRLYGVMSKRKGSPVARSSRAKRPSPDAHSVESIGTQTISATQPMEGLKMESQSRPSRIKTVSDSNREISELFEIEYQDEIREYMEEMETKTLASTEHMDMQPELQWYMRPYLVNFLIEFHLQFRLRPETLYLALNIVDRYVSKRIVYKKHYQLVGCAAIWIAAKFEDSKERVPTVEDLAQMCCGAYEEGAFIQMEGHVLVTIGWIIGHPTAEAWLRYYGVKPSSRDDQKTLHIAKYIMEHSLFHRGFIKQKTSHIAAASLCLARVVLGKSNVTECSKEVYTVIQELESHINVPTQQLSSVLLKKYSLDGFSRAAETVTNWYADGHTYSASFSALIHQNTVGCETPKAFLPTPPRSSGRFHRKNSSSVSMHVEDVISMIHKASKENVPPMDSVPTSHSVCAPTVFGRVPLANASWEVNRTEVGA